MRKPGKRLFRPWKRLMGGKYKITRILLLSFIIGILLGIVLVDIGIELEHGKISTHMESFLHNFNRLDYQRSAVIKESLFKYGLFLVLIWFLGFFPAGALGALALLLVKGLGLGFTMAFFMKHYGLTGLFYITVLTLPQNLGIIPAYFLVCCNCLRFILEQGGFLEDSQTPPLSILEYCLVLMICLGVTLAVSFYEAFAVPWIFENLLQM